jgi:phosphate starvation-inducible PhoH-like protein
MSRKNQSTFLNYNLLPKTEGQSSYIQALERSVVTFCDGPAGTGKTHISTCFAVDLLRRGIGVQSSGAIEVVDIQRIVVTRPIVDAGRSIGYLPGTMEEKVHPYLMPIYDELHHCLERNYLAQLMRERTIEICPLQMMRGRNFHRSFIICDEAQNATWPELRTLLTRMGRHSRVCISGDPTQTDLPKSEAGAFMKIAERLGNHDLITHVSLDSNDIIRNKLIADIERLLCGS